MRRRGAALAAAAMLLVSVAGCETTQQQSAKIGRALGKQSAIAAQTSLGRASGAVRVTRKVLLSAGGSAAVALELTNASAQAQVAFPVLIDVANAAGKSVYRNDTEGIEPSLQQLALLAPHASAWWVDNEVLASAPKSVSAKIGASTQTALYAVILKGAAPVGAGRAVVASLAAGASTQVLIPVVGAIDGRTIALTAAPTRLH